MKKLIKLTDKSAVQVTPIQIGEKRMIDVRMMYRTQKQLDADDKTWMRGFKGLSIPVDDDVALKVARSIAKFVKDEDTEYEVIALKDDDDGATSKKTRTRDAKGAKLKSKKK